MLSTKYGHDCGALPPCPNPGSRSRARPFLVKFESLDVTRTGRIDKRDLELMVQRSQTRVDGRDTQKVEL